MRSYTHSPTTIGYYQNMPFVPPMDISGVDGPAMKRDNNRPKQKNMRTMIINNQDIPSQGNTEEVVFPQSPKKNTKSCSDEDRKVISIEKV